MSDKETKRTFAVFDIDGTLVRWQLFHAIVHGLGKHGYLPKGAHDRIKQARMAWKIRSHKSGFKRYESVLVNEYVAAIKNVTPDQYAAVVDEVFDEYKDQTYIYTRDLIRNLKRQGYFLIAISGSHDEVVQKLARYYGFDAAVGAKLAQAKGQFSGRADSPIDNKAGVLKRLVKQHGLTAKGSIGVGDSKSDVSMLEIAENPIVFNPDKELFKEAKSRQWKIVVERKSIIYELASQNGQYVLQ